MVLIIDPNTGWLGKSVIFGLIFVNEEAIQFGPSTKVPALSFDITYYTSTYFFVNNLVENITSEVGILG